MRRGQRFESARRLFRKLAIRRKIVKISENPGTTPGPMYCNPISLRIG